MAQININLEQPPQLGQTPELRSGTKWLNRLWILLNDIKTITNTVTGIDSTINARINALDNSKVGKTTNSVVTGLVDFSTLPTLEADPTGSTQAARKGYVDGVIHTRKHAIDSTLDHDAISGGSGTIPVLSSSGYLLSSGVGINELLKKVFNPIYYNDLYIGLESAKTPASNAPTWSTFTTNLNAYTFDIDDYFDLSTTELLHGWEEGTDIELHIHWATNGSNVDDRKVKWQIFYSWGDNGEVFSAESNSENESTITGGTTSLTHLYTSIGTISGANYKIGSIIKMRIKRIASTGTEPTADPFGLMVGIHYRINTIGSLNQSSK
jgi:hypothetical protein